MAKLLSYPRSGNTWLRYCIEFLSKKPTANPKSKLAGGNSICQVIPNMGVDLNAASICSKSHNTTDINNRHKIIVLVRDYKESIVRHYNILPKKQIYQTFLKETSGKKRTGVDYIKILEFFDEFEGEKILIYYEDLILNPSDSILKVLDFLEIDHLYVKEFFKKYKFHHSQGLKSYHGGSFTKGAANKLKAHQNSLSSTTLAKMTNSLKTNHKYIFDKYLKRYE